MFHSKNITIGNKIITKNKIKNPTPSLWFQGTVPSSTLPRFVQFGDGKFVITGGDSGWVNTSVNGEVFTTTSITGPGATCRKYAYGNGVHVLARSGTSVYTSPNFTTWTTRTVTAITVNYIHWSDVLNMFVMVGDSGAMRTSTNGAFWGNVTSGFGSSHIFKVASGNGVAVATGAYGTVRYSTDGATWNSVTISGLPTNYPAYVTFGNGRFVIASQAGHIYTSTNGTSWTQQTKLDNNSVNVGVVANVSDLHADETGVVVFCGTQDINTGSRGIYTTNDFITYKAVNSGINENVVFESVVKGNDTWVVTGTNRANMISYSHMNV